MYVRNFQLHLLMVNLDGDQTYFPEYIPDAEDLKARMKKAEGPSLVDHYDATKEGKPSISHL